MSSRDDLRFDDGWTVDATVKTEDAYFIDGFTLSWEESPDARFDSTTDRCSIGSDASNDLVVDDNTVSRFHCEVLVSAAGVRVRDLDSRNGTRVDGVRVLEGWLKDGSRIRAGRSTIRFALAGRQNRLPLSPRRELGTMVGASVPMRAIFAQIERVAPTEVTVLISGETGTGKEEAAATIHQLSRRKDAPFVVVDCGAIPPNLLESYLFGHEKGSFTGAHRDRIGAFEQADGGTLFLDEIGELPLGMQPKLLRVLESREVRRIGSAETSSVDVRIVAATNRDLRVEVATNRFREDLFYRLAVIRVYLPPLRERTDDIPLLLERFLADLPIDVETEERLRLPSFVAELRRAAWPGNVRQLRNHIQRAAILADLVPLPARAEASLRNLIDLNLPYHEARRQLVAHFEQVYADSMIAAHGGNVSKAARAAGIGRSYLHRLLKRGAGSNE